MLMETGLLPHVPIERDPITLGMHVASETITCASSQTQIECDIVCFEYQVPTTHCSSGPRCHQWAAVLSHTAKRTWLMFGRNMASPTACRTCD
jgi:hypothetical protein